MKGLKTTPTDEEFGSRCYIYHLTSFSNSLFCNSPILEYIEYHLVLFLKTTPTDDGVKVLRISFGIIQQLTIRQLAYLGVHQVPLGVILNPFTPESDQCQISPAASASILRHIVWRT